MGTGMRRILVGRFLLAAGLLTAAGAVSSDLGASYSRAAPSSLRAALQATDTGAGSRPLRAPTPLSTVSKAAHWPPDGQLAAISIPRLGITDAPIFDRGTDSRGNMLIARGYSVTHFALSAGIGRGNAVLYGHDDIEGSIFAHLQQLRAGDEVEIITGDSVGRYRVTERKIVPPTAVEILNPTSDVRLTIFTCWPTWVDNQRVVITAKPIS